jgi:hypothetical protein
MPVLSQSLRKPISSRPVDAGGARKRVPSAPNVRIQGWRSREAWTGAVAAIALGILGVKTAIEAHAPQLFGLGLLIPVGITLILFDYFSYVEVDHMGITQSSPLSSRRVMWSEIEGVAARRTNVRTWFLLKICTLWNIEVRVAGKQTMHIAGRDGTLRDNEFEAFFRAIDKQVRSLRS